MATMSVSDFSSFINHQIKAQEQIETCLWQLEALITVAVLAEDFYKISEIILHNYFSIAGDLIEKVSKINQAALGDLLKQRLPENVH